MTIKKKKICVIGHFGFGHDLLNGQTIKTKIVTNEIEKNFGKDEVVRIDTHGGLATILKLPFVLLYAVIFFKNLVVMPAHNGLRIIAPLLVFYNQILKKELHYVVVGGWLPDFLKNKPFLSKILKHFQFIYVETRAMKSSLMQVGFYNVLVMPNFKDLKILNGQDMPQFPLDEFRFCTFSRVMKEKGIEEAISAIKKVNENIGKDICSLDIYGQIEENQIQWFEQLQKKFPPFVQYKGCVPFDKSVETLKNYYALLFPTYYSGEGFAGTLLDSFAAGVPVIASDWHYNADIVDNGENGLIVPAMDVESLASKIEWCVQNKDLFPGMKKKCLEKAKIFLPENGIKPLIMSLV
jgi:glycosyltransferase involved in cell wall biosynthesis